MRPPTKPIPKSRDARLAALIRLGKTTRLPPRPNA